MLLEVERRGAIAIVTLNRPEALNALSRELRVTIADVFADLREDAAVNAIVLTGAGRAFCAGVDLKELGSGQLTAAGPERNPADAITSCGKPVVAAINGVVVTGGLELALSCDLMIASTAARFADTHARVGVMPAWGMSQRLSRAVGMARAKEMSLTGNFIDAVTALNWGLVNRVVAPEALIDTSLRLAEDLASIPRPMSRAYKALIEDGFGMNLPEALRLEKERANAYNVNAAKVVSESRAGAMARNRIQGESQEPS